MRRGMLRFLYRLFLERKNPVEQVILGLIYLVLGAACLYFAVKGVVIGEYLYRMYYLIYFGIIFSALGVLSVIWGLGNLVRRSWNRRFAKPKPVQPKEVRYVPPKKHNSTVQAKSSRSKQSSQSRAGQAKKGRVGK